MDAWESYNRALPPAMWRSISVAGLTKYSKVRFQYFKIIETRKELQCVLKSVFGVRETNVETCNFNDVWCQYFRILYFIKRIVTANKLNNTEITIIIKRPKLGTHRPQPAPKSRKNKVKHLQKSIPAEAPKAPELRDFFISWALIIIVTRKN